jgi:DNA-binding SARP family transcriptional activator
VLEFRMFGGLEAVLDGVPVPLGRPKQRALLAALLLDANRAVSVDRLTEELWANEPPASARHSLEVYVSGLRKTLGADRVVTVAPGYAVRVEPTSWMSRGSSNCCRRGAAP